MSQYVLTMEMIQQERARRARVREQERARTKSQLKLLSGGKLSKNGENASEGNSEQTASR